MVANIGALYGDEGKGLMTDFYVRLFGPTETTVVRFNGGAQAGHTVVTPEGDRHVFSHFGAGTLAGSNTFLSEFFIVNPIVFLREKEELEKLNVVPVVILHCKAIVTTPYDMFINHTIEAHRGVKGEHGSCGLGINETVVRSLTRSILTVEHMRSLTKEGLYSTLRDIANGYVPLRLGQLGLPVDDKVLSFINDVNITHKFVEDFYKMMRFVYTTSDYNYLRGNDKHIVFEGAQGLMLDEAYGFFPHLTRSNCGLENVVAILKQLELSPDDKVVANFITRAYTTRHGKGPLPSERNRMYGYTITDKTNLYNQYQGSLRFGLYNQRVVENLIVEDTNRFLGDVPCTLLPRRTTTCVDQINVPFDSIDFIDYDGKQKTIESTEFVRIITAYSWHASYGPTYEDVRSRSDAIQFWEET